MRKEMTRKIAGLLAGVLLVGISPVTVLAEGTVPIEETQETQVEDNAPHYEDMEKWRDLWEWDESAISNARWTKPDHINLIKETATYINIGMNIDGADANKYNIMLKASELADSRCKVSMKTLETGESVHINGAIHGFGNYYVNVEAFAKYARFVQLGNAPADAEELTKDFIDNTYKKLSVKSMMELFTSLSAVTVLLEDETIGISNATARKYFVYGIALHSIQDTYAHRTLVPDYALPEFVNGAVVDQSYFASNNVQDYTSKIGTDDFEDDVWSDIIAVKESVEGNKLTFSRLINFMKESRIDMGGQKYSDNPAFCKERFRVALVASRVFLETVRANEIPVGTETIISRDSLHVNLVSSGDYLEQLK